MHDVFNNSSPIDLWAIYNVIFKRTTNRIISVERLTSGARYIVLNVMCLEECIRCALENFQFIHHINS